MAMVVGRVDEGDAGLLIEYTVSKDEYRYQYFNYSAECQFSSSCKVEDKSDSSQCRTTHSVDTACAAAPAPTTPTAFDRNRADVCSSLIAAGDVR